MAEDGGAGGTANTRTEPRRLLWAVNGGLGEGEGDGGEVDGGTQSWRRLEGAGRSF